MKPTAHQLATAALAASGDGTLVRHLNGLWMIPGEAMAIPPTPGRYATTATVLAMHRKGMVTMTKTSGNALGKFATEVKLSQP